MDFIDLHVHSTASDGSVRPGDLVRMALEKGLYAFALTDHDTVDGIDEAVEAAAGKPIGVIPGVELSCLYGSVEVHVLGLNIDYRNPDFQAALKQLEHLRYDRNEQICELLRARGVQISMNILAKKYGSSLVTRGNIAEYLTIYGYADSIADAFDRYIGEKAPCYVPRYKLSVPDAVRLVKAVGGTCSLAHPVQYELPDNDYSDLFSYAKKSGVECIEGYHPDNSPEDERKFLKLAAEYGFKLTGGSDFHGSIKPDITMGTGRGNIMVPRKLLASINLR